MYPDAGNISWAKKETAYEVSFQFKKTDFIMLFMEDGGVEWTKTRSAVSVLPEKISQYVSTSLGGQTITDALRVVNGFGVVTWEVKAGGKTYLFNEQGEFLGLLQ